GPVPATGPVTSNVSKERFIRGVEKAREYIRAGHIYQVNLSHRLETEYAGSGWQLHQQLKEVSPAPYSAYLNAGDFELISSSPEMFLRMSGPQIQTRPIKGTRPRCRDATRHA